MVWQLRAAFFGLLIVSACGSEPERQQPLRGTAGSGAGRGDPGGIVRAPDRRDAGSEDAGDDADGGAEMPRVRAIMMDASVSAPARPIAEPEACKTFVMPSDCSVPANAVLPSELRCTGLYGDPERRRLACGVEPYAPAYELWSDGAEKHRFIALPPDSKIDASDPDNFVFPAGTQIWKEFRVDVKGERKPAETRLLRKSEQGWLYTTYVWSEDGKRAVQQNAGANDLFGSGHDVPNRDQCRACHEGRPDFVLGWDLLMLGEGASGLTRAELVKRKWITSDRQASIPGSELERAALGYLHANCGVSCHNITSHASARDTGLLLRLELGHLANARETAAASGVNRVPRPDAKLPAGGPFYDIRPGDPEHSLLLARMKVRGIEAQMPRIGTHRVDAEDHAEIHFVANGDSLLKLIKR